jgi:hypothetical protein
MIIEPSGDHTEQPLEQHRNPLARPFARLEQMRWAAEADVEEYVTNHPPPR